MRESSIHRVVGRFDADPKIQEEKKQAVLQKQVEKFRAQNFKDIEENTREKTPEEIHVIGLINEVSNRTLRACGLQDFDIPPRNVHVFKHSRWPKKEEGKEHAGAIFEPVQETIALPENDLPIFAHYLLHEMLHAKLYNALQIKMGSGGLSGYHTGLMVASRSGSRRKLNWMNEAFIEELTIKYFTEVFKDPIFTNFKEQTKRLITRNKSLLKPYQLLPQYGLYYARVLKGSGKSAAGEVYDADGNRIKGSFLDVWRTLCPEERAVFNILLGKLYRKNTGTFENQGKVFEEFARAAATGKMLPFTRLIERTFGRGTLDKILKLGDDTKELKKLFEKL